MNKLDKVFRINPLYESDGYKSRHTIYSMINEPLKRRKNKMKNFTFKIEEYGYS